jgi:probable rRNA maturation factor
VRWAAAEAEPHWTMILIEPTIQAKYGRALRQRSLAAFLREASAAIGLRGDVSVLLTGDRQIRSLNREFRKKDQATDVLSFPAAPNGHEPMAGDLAVSVETAARQAEEHGHPLATELQILVLHGLLHLDGYDHEADEGQMARKEAALRRRFGLRAGLIERSAQPAGRTPSRRRRP